MPKTSAFSSKIPCEQFGRILVWSLDTFFRTSNVQFSCNSLNANAPCEPCNLLVSVTQHGKFGAKVSYLEENLEYWFRFLIGEVGLSGSKKLFFCKPKLPSLSSKCLTIYFQKIIITAMITTQTQVVQQKGTTWTYLFKGYCYQGIPCLLKTNYNLNDFDCNPWNLCDASLKPRLDDLRHILKSAIRKKKVAFF